MFLAQDSVQEKLKLGIEAARRGDKAAAQILLRQVVAIDEANELVSSLYTEIRTELQNLNLNNSEIYNMIEYLMNRQS